MQCPRDSEVHVYLSLYAVTQWSGVILQAPRKARPKTGTYFALYHSQHNLVRSLLLNVQPGRDIERTRDVESVSNG